jgi:hypothetical protein
MKSIEVTPEMVEAGVNAINRWDSLISSSSVSLREEIVKAVFWAMESSQERQPHSTEKRHNPKAGGNRFGPHRSSESNSLLPKVA